LTAQSTKTGEATRGLLGRPGAGFTLIEIMIVFALIGILVGLALPRYQHSRRRAQEAVLKENLFQMRLLIGQYYTDKDRIASLRAWSRKNTSGRSPSAP
jgi:prepilin-type N-terminal cleavage/methylation domain-containing protein